ncbi:MAG: HAD family hydrolase [Acidimicrobiales bacterium]
MPDRRVVVFDLDGCILDSTEPILWCLNEALGEFGLDPLPRDQLARHVGPPLQHTVATILDERGAPLDLVDPLVAAYRDRYRTVSIELAATYPGMAELVTSLAESERLGVCTSKPARWAVPILEHLGLADAFELIAGPGLTEAEPKIETLGRAIEALSPLDRAASVMVGDRHHDVEAARHHGLVPVGVTWGFGSRSELEEAGARVVVDAPIELAGTLGR